MAGKAGPTNKVSRCGDLIVIHLSQGRSVLVDLCDYILVAGLRWCASRATGHADLWYAKATLTLPGGKKSTVMMHRLLLGLSQADHQRVDHVDGNGLNNIRCNIRIASQQQNCQNRRKKPGCSSRFKGVSLMRRAWHLNKPWLAQIKPPGAIRQQKLGHFATEREAAEAYNQAAREHFGEFAKLNDLEPTGGN